MINVTFNITVNSPEDLQAYFAALQAFQDTASAFNAAGNVTIAERGDPPLPAPSRGESEETTLSAEYRTATGQILRRTKAEIAAGQSRLDCLRAWKAGERVEPPSDAMESGEEPPPPKDDGAEFL